MERAAIITHGEACRPVLFRTWDRSRPMFGWLMTNPSDADHRIDDRTVRRVVDITDRHGGGGIGIVNDWSLRTPYPAELWRMLAAGRYAIEMQADNEAWIETIGHLSSRLVVAFGAEPMRRHPEYCRYLLAVFSADWTRPLDCLGTTDDGLPLHPLARGRFAIRRDVKLRSWSVPL